jgi:glucose-6-phosphate dehydrogenase assembly protein OpcA
MIVRDETISIDHGVPKKVELSEIEMELEALTGESGEPAKARRTFGRALTLAVYCESGDLPEVMDEMVGQIITRSSARAIVIRAEPNAGRTELEAWIRAHCLTRGEADTQLCAEQITLHARGDAIQQLHISVLNLRLGNLPLVVWWRGQPELDSTLFLELFRADAQIIFDSARFAAPTVQLGELVARLKREFARILFGDINWGRLMPWRELVAQFFDNPDHLKYLKQLSEIVLEYSAAAGGNPAQAILFTMWLATMLDWDVAGGSWRRDGRDRSLRLRDKDREIQVEIRGRVNVQSPPGWLNSVTLHSTVEPEATFQVTWCEEDCAVTQVKIGNKVTERIAALNIPDEVSLVCSEFDASHRDRVYHHALQILEQLLT